MIWTDRLRKWVSRPRLTAVARLLLVFGLAVGLYFAADLSLDLPPEELEFRSEIVSASLTSGGEIQISGTYTFFAAHPARRSYRLLFPMSKSSSDLPPKNILVYCDRKNIPFRVLSQGIEFTLTVVPRQEQEVRISYVVPKSQKVTYITRTATLWRRPLQQASFVLLSTRLSSNYHIAGQSTVTYAPFRPEDDFVVERKW